nr:unnamed protein product [Spirometra erinaceieuropaei]
MVCYALQVGSNQSLLHFALALFLVLLLLLLLLLLHNSTTDGPIPVRIPLAFPFSVSDRDWETFLRYTVEDGEKLNDKNQLGLLEKDKRNLPDHPELPKTVTFSEHVEITDISPPRSVQRESSPIYITQSNDEYGIPTSNSDNIHNLSDQENLRTFPGQSICSDEIYPEYAKAGPLFAGICLPELLKVKKSK